MKQLTLVIIIGLLAMGCKHETTTSIPEQESTPSPIEELTDEEYAVWRAHQDSIGSHLRTIIQSIADGDYNKLATVTNFPVWRQYPEKEIMNPSDLKEMFDILFDDSIKVVMQKASPQNWNLVGWRGYLFDNGLFWATEEGILDAVNYESSKLKAYIAKLRKEEEDDAAWPTYVCLVSKDSTLFLRIQKQQESVKLKMKFRDQKTEQILNGRMETQGSCGNDVYWFACDGGDTIMVGVTGPRCMGEAEIDNYIDIPNSQTLPEQYRNKFISLSRAYWREAKIWWYN